MLIVPASKAYNEEVSLWATHQMRRGIATGITRLVERLSYRLDSRPFFQGVTKTEYKCYRLCHNHKEMAVPSPEGDVN